MNLGSTISMQVPAPLPDDDEIDLMALFSTLWRGKWIIAIWAILAVFAGGYYAYIEVTPLFKARTVIILESREGRVINFDSVIGGLSDDYYVVNSEVAVLESRELMEKVVVDLGLEDDPEFNGALREPTRRAQIFGDIKWQIKDRIKSLLGIEDPPGIPLSEEAHARRTLDLLVSALLGKVTISNDRESLVFVITATTEEANKSALIADTVAELYIQDQVDVKLAASAEASDWLTARVAELQTELETAEARLSE
ncbi:MAG: Wzz/FepE/Etk N-terminal domain-containing protein, partial [Halocynthiibacter sp.]